MATRRSFLSLASTWSRCAADSPYGQKKKKYAIDGNDGIGLFAQLNESMSRNAQDDASFRVKLKHLYTEGDMITRQPYHYND